MYVRAHRNFQCSCRRHLRLARSRRRNINCFFHDVRTKVSNEVRRRIVTFDHIIINEPALKRLYHENNSSILVLIHNAKYQK